MALEVVLPPLTSILVARAMGPAKLGAYSYILWVSQMALLVGTFGVPVAARKYLAEYFGRGDDRSAGAVFRLTTFAQGAAGTVMVVAGLLAAQMWLPPDERGFARLAIVSILPGAMMGIATAANAAREDFGANVIPSVAGMLVHASGIILTLILGWDLTGLAGALLASRTADCALRWRLLADRLPQGWALFGGNRHALAASTRREILTFCWHATVLLVLNLVVWNRSEMFFLRRFCAIEQVAFFSVAFGFAALPAQLAGPFSRAAGASLFVEQGRSQAGAARLAALFMRYMTLVVFPAALGLAILSGPLVRTLYGPSYLAAIPVLAASASLGLIGPLADPATGLITAGGGQRRLVRWSLLAAVLTLLLDTWLVSRHCAIGGAVANGLGQIITTAGTCTIAVRHFGLRIAPRFLRLVAAAALVMAIAVLPVVWLSRGGWPSLVVAPPLGVVVYLLMIRQLGILDAGDHARLEVATSILPARFRRLYGRALTWVTGVRGATLTHGGSRQ